MGKPQRKNKKAVADLEKEIETLRVELAERKLLETQTEWTFNRIKDETWKLNTIFNCLPNGVRIISDDHKVLFQNKWVETHFGNQKGKICYESYMKRDTPCPNCLIKRALEHNAAQQGGFSQNNRHYELVAAPVGTFDHKRAGVEIVIDITEAKIAKESILREKQKYADLLDNLNVGVYRSLPEPESRFLEVNPALVAMLDAESKEELLEHRAAEIYRDPKRRKQLSQKLIRVGFIKEEEVELVSRKGKIFWAAISAVRKKDDSGNDYFDGIIEDISDRKHASEEIQRLYQELQRSNLKLRQSVLKDTLTGLYNYHYLTEMAEIELARAKRYNYPFAVIMLDIDGFRAISEHYGYATGDVILKKLAEKIMKIVRLSDIVVRFGGDEFIILLPRADEPQARFLVERLLHTLKQYNFGRRQEPLKISLTAAVAAYPKNAVKKGMDLVQIAENRLHQSKTADRRQ